MARLSTESIPSGLRVSQRSGFTGSASLDIAATSARKLRRFKRCFHRVMSGLERGGEFRLLTLTSSPDSPPDIHRSFRILIKRLKRRGLIQGYIQVKEVTKSGLVHIHLLFRGKYIAQRLLSKWWEEIHKAKVVDIRFVRGGRGKKGLAIYMAKYMAKEVVRRFSWSWDWVWRGFVRDWEALKKKWRRMREINPAVGVDVLIWLWRVMLVGPGPPVVKWGG